MQRNWTLRIYGRGGLMSWSMKQPLTPTHRRLRLEWYHTQGHWSAAEWNHVVFSDESRFHFSSDDDRARVWRLRGERLNPAFAFLGHTSLTAGVIVWDVFAYNTRSTLVLIRDTVTIQWGVHGIMQLHVLPLRQRLPGAIFQQDNARLQTARVSKDYLRTFTTLPLPG
ncbi:transposable element Tcb2 transposase [Trichonephila clavipes]|nr:transposable element Tcb2 transposase [Trichonephila clavipes]